MMAKDRSRRGRVRHTSALLGLAALVLIVSCHRRADDDQPVLPPDQLANAIEQVRVEHKEVPTPPRRLDFLLPADLARATDIRCTLRQHGRPVLVAGSRHAFARVDSKPVLLDVAGAMDSSAAFFRGHDVTISLGRHGQVERAADKAGAGWPVGVTVGGLMSVEDEKVEAIWSCG